MPLAASRTDASKSCAVFLLDRKCVLAVRWVKKKTGRVFYKAGPLFKFLRIHVVHTGWKRPMKTSCLDSEASLHCPYACAKTPISDIYPILGTVLGTGVS